MRRRLVWYILTNISYDSIVFIHKLEVYFDALKMVVASSLRKDPVYRNTVSHPRSLYCVSHSCENLKCQ